MSKTLQSISQYFDEPTEVIVKIRNKEHKFLFHEISKADMDEIYRPVREAKGDDAATAQANENVVKSAIHKIVSTVDGEFFTEEQVPELPVTLLNKIGNKVVAFMTGGDHEAAGEEKPKDEPTEELEDPKD